MIIEGRVVEVRSADGTRLHTRVFGPDTAPAVVLTHGVLCRRDFWHNQIEALRGRYRVIVFDHRGHGDSDAPRVRDYSLDHLADDLQAVLTATLADGERAVVAGHSMGGIALISWALRYRDQVSERLAGAALLNTTSGEILRNVNVLQCTPQWQPYRLQLARVAGRITRMPTPQYLPLRRRLLAYAAIGRGADRSVSRTIDAMCAAASPRGRRGLGMMLINLTESLDVTALTVPTVVVGSRADRIAPLARSHRLAAELPHVLDLIEIPGGHCGPLEYPDAVDDVLDHLCRHVFGAVERGKETEDSAASR